MIFHAALPADDPQKAARTFARILGGSAMPFPPGPESWMAWSADGATELEFVPRGLYFVPGEAEVDIRSTGVATRHSDWHVAMGTVVPAEEILKIAAEAGWPAKTCQRGPFFRCIEVWIDGTTLIEVLDPSMQAEYRASMTPANWKKVFDVEAAA
jgi:predicted small integral membrane protein